MADPQTESGPDGPAPEGGGLTPAAALALANVRVVLARPIYGGNVGSICRCMTNMGLSDLAIAGETAADWAEARKMACWAQPVLDGRTMAATLAKAVADCAIVLGATARPGLYRQHARTPREWAPFILRTAQSGKVALLFGPEDNGLDNAELAVCTHLIQIPSSEAYRSLNLSHAVMVCLYEVFVAAGVFEPAPEKSPLAPSRMKERMFDMWAQALLEIGFMDADKAQHMMLGVRRIFSRGPLTGDDVRILMGIARQTRWCAKQLAQRPGPATDGPVDADAPPDGV